MYIWLYNSSPVPTCVLNLSCSLLISADRMSIPSRTTWHTRARTHGRRETLSSDNTRSAHEQLIWMLGRKAWWVRPKTSVSLQNLKQSRRKRFVPWNSETAAKQFVLCRHNTEYKNKTRHREWSRCVAGSSGCLVTWAGPFLVSGWHGGLDERLVRAPLLTP